VGLVKSQVSTIISNITVAATATSAASTAIDTSTSVLNAVQISFTAASATATPLAQIQIFGSADGVTYDTSACATYDVSLASPSIQSFSINCPLRYFVVKVKNNDASYSMTSVYVYAQTQVIS